MMMGAFVEIYEVGPRDGLQNESTMIAAEDKITLIDLLSKAGFKHIEVTSFVSPKWVPQMSDAAEVMAGITREDEITYAVLTPNMRGFEGAVAAKADEVAIFGAASEGFSQKNINCSIAESLERFAPVMVAADEAKIPVRGYVSCVVACPYDGAIAPEHVRAVSETLLEMGCYEISLGDTIGAGRPDDIKQLMEEMVKTIPADKLAGHFHDTSGRAIEITVDVAANLHQRLMQPLVVWAAVLMHPGQKVIWQRCRWHDTLKTKGMRRGLIWMRWRRLKIFWLH